MPPSKMGAGSEEVIVIENSGNPYALRPTPGNPNVVGKLIIAIFILIAIMVLSKPDSSKRTVSAETPIAQQEVLSVQDRKAMSQNLGASLQRELADMAVTRTAFRNISDETAWLQEMSRRLGKYMPDEAERLEFLTTLHWEASRAGVDPQLLLGLIQIKSGFEKYKVSPDGARGYMQVMPFWTKAIGNPDHNLFQLRTNLRYGALILRHYIDIEKGDLFLALGRYNGSRGRAEFPTLVVRAWKNDWDYTSISNQAE